MSSSRALDGYPQLSVEDIQLSCDSLIEFLSEIKRITAVLPGDELLDRIGSVITLAREQRGEKPTHSSYTWEMMTDVYQRATGLRNKLSHFYTSNPNSINTDLRPPSLSPRQVVEWASAKRTRKCEAESRTFLKNTILGKIGRCAWHLTRQLGTHLQAGSETPEDRRTYEAAQAALSVCSEIIDLCRCS